jgi:hypothetical protein
MIMDTTLATDSCVDTAGSTRRHRRERALRNRSIFATLLVLLSSLSFAQSVSRDALINQIEAHYVSTAVFSADSPIIGSILQPAMRANPGIDEATWRSVKGEAAEAITKLITEKGSILDVLIRSSLQSLSDKELKSLDQLLSNIAFRKFQAAMSGPVAQQQIQSGMAKAGIQIMPLINTVLASHQLKEVH